MCIKRLLCTFVGCCLSNIFKYVPCIFHEVPYVFLRVCICNFMQPEINMFLCEVGEKKAQ